MNRKRLLSLLLGIVVTIPIAACAAGTAQASPNQISIMQDDDLLVNGSAQKADHALRVMAGMGVEYVRVTVLWSNVARGIKSSAHFNGKDPAAYPHANWDRYDNLVVNAGNDGIGVYLDVTGPGPAFSHTKAPNRYKKYNAAWMPNPTQFYRFVAAVGKRYSGTYRKETGSHQLLPRVSFWSLWNEPNQAGWLAPQSILSPVAHKVIPYAPMAYRRLFQLGRQALTSTGHDRDYIVAGETAPSGRGSPSVNNPLSPVKFIQEMLCVNGANVPYTGTAAAARNCSDFSRYGSIKASAWGHHPYTKAIPPETPANPGDITIANLATLPGLLDNLAVVTGHISSGLSVVASEFGYETNPPDPFAGTSLANQAAWDNQGDFLAYSTPRVVGMTQFQLRDAGPNRSHPVGSKAYWNTYQAGLLNGAGHQKPSYQAYILPLVTFSGGTDPATGGALTGFWGQLRFLPHSFGDLTTPQTVQFKFQAIHTTDWVPYGPAIPVTNGHDFFVGTLPYPGPGALEATWTAHMPPYRESSRPVPVPDPGSAGLK
ncbi:MAG: hypothetical protein QOH12_2251 [Solirubrobacteraceae bacterium]|jgi:hypothetical protein|nr:hypothetical protein [Solirubrobacteraceae bacterium]